jgi:preprotein translocase subunit SecA
VDIEQLGIDWTTVVHQELEEKLFSHLKRLYEDKEALLTPARMREFERIILLQIIDSQWKDHLLGMDYLKEGIGLRGYGQRDPLVEYKKESFDMFQAMLDRIEEETVRYLFLLQPVAEEEIQQRRRQQPLIYGQPQDSPGFRPKQQARSMIPGRKKKHR